MKPARSPAPAAPRGRRPPAARQSRFRGGKLDRSVPLALAGLVLVFLGGCLDVEQHPRWDRGSYDGKTDQLPHQARFHADRLAWNAALTDRTLLQDEYRRAVRPGVPETATTSTKP